MGQVAGGGGQKPAPKGELTELGGSKLVVTHVEVIKQREVIKVPVLEEVVTETIKYVPREEETVKYVKREEPTINYLAEVRETVRYTPREEETIKYVPREVQCEKPIIVDKVYERPVVNTKEYQIVTYNDIECIRELMGVLPDLLKQLKELRSTKIVEEIVKVPKIQYVPTTIKKISGSGELVEG